MRERKNEKRKLITSTNEIEYDYSLPVELGEEALSNYVDVSLLIPYGEKNSVARAELMYSGMKNSVFPSGPYIERPIVDSIFTNDIIRSSYNYKTESTVKLLDKIEKIINGYVCETTYIYETYYKDDNNITQRGIHIESVPRYRTFYKYGQKVFSELANLEVGEESTKPLYTTYIENLDPSDGGMAWGRNINTIFSVSGDVGEDAVMISESTAKKFQFNYMDDIEFTLNPEYDIMKNLYGDEKVYKPFPLPGEYVNESGVVVSISDNQGDDILSVSDTVENSDTTYYVHEGFVYDIDVYCNYDSIISQDSFLYELYQIQREYIKNITLALAKLDQTYFTKETMSRKNKLIGITQSELRVGKKDLRNKIYVKIRICNDMHVDITNKLTNRHGAKGMTSTIYPDGYVIAEDGTHIDAVLCIASTMNRENPGQLMEKDLNGLNVFFRKYLNESSDSVKIKYNNIIRWVELTNQQRLADNIRTMNPADIVEYYSNNWIRIKHDPFGNEMKLIDFFELFKFTNSLYPIEPFTIYMGGKPLSEKHYYGMMFFYQLKNFGYYDTSIRTDEVVTTKGSASKRAESKKEHHTKMNTTSAKSSNLSTTIIINSLDSSDRNILENNTSSIHNYMDALGIEFEVTEEEDE